MAEELKELVTTGIGSLPHQKVAGALDLAFATEIPFYPTLPQHHPSEGMLAQGIWGLPGVEILNSSALRLDREVWRSGREAFQEKIGEAINRNTYLDFLPSAQTSLWEEFWLRLESSPSSWAKTQLVGPLTLGLGLAGLETWAIPERAEFLRQMQDMLFVKAMAMHAALRLREKRTLIYLDEPGLGSFSAKDPWHRQLWDRLLEFQEELQNQGMRAGIHCCGAADFSPLLLHSVQVLSIDSALSLKGILRDSGRLCSWLEAGGRLSLGLIPTQLPLDWNPGLQVQALRKSFAELGETALRSCLLTPACGLGNQSVGEAEKVFNALREFQARLRT